jgi:hypothetical protein
MYLSTFCLDCFKWTLPSHLHSSHIHTYIHTYIFIYIYSYICYIYIYIYIYIYTFRDTRVLSVINSPSPHTHIKHSTTRLPGFSSRFLFTEFVRKYAPIQRDCCEKGTPREDTLRLLASAGIPLGENVQMGTSKVFLRTGTYLFCRVLVPVREMSIGKSVFLETCVYILCCMCTPVGDTGFGKSAF